MKSFTLFLGLCLSLGAADLSPEKQKTMAAQIDKAVIEGLNKQKIAMSSPASDESFLRRIYLDAVGRIPTLTETKEFLSSKDPDKRNNLIDRLLDSPGYVSHNFNYWSDVLRVTDRMRYGVANNYKVFIRNFVYRNQGYDKFVHEMLSSDGPAFEEGNGATAYYLRDAAMPLDNLSNTMQIFLGTSMVCAQCHDHPFDKWSQMDFYKLAAFTAGTKSNNYIDKKDPEVRKLQEYKKEIKEDKQKANTFKQMTEVLYAGISHQGTGQIRLPHDYDYDDAKPLEVIKAGTPYGPKVALTYPEQKPERDSKGRVKKKKKPRKNMPAPGEDISSRKAFADWVTSRENPMFTKTIVNRMWDKVIGAPLVGPLMMLKEDKMGPNPELTNVLLKQMKDVNYNLKDFMRVLLKTKLYQSKAVTTPPAGDKNYFAGPQIRRMTAEQMWDSLMALTVEKPDAKVAMEQSLSQREIIYRKVSDMNSKQIIELAEKANTNGKSYFKNLVKNEGMSMSMQAGMMDEEKRLDQKEESLKLKYKELSQKMKEAKKEKDRDKYNGLRKEQNVLRTAFNDLKKMKSMNKNSSKFTRASEMKAPMDGNHFLRRFGSSDREIIDGGSKEPSVPQALSLLNGQIEDYITANSVSSINRHMNDAKTPEDKIKTAFLSILSRNPKDSELSMFKQQFAKNETQAAKDLIWVLINSNEFMFLK